MKKNNIRKCLFFIAAVTVLTVTGCAKSFDIEPSGLAAEVLDKVTFDCELSQVSDEGIKNFFDLDDEAEGLVFMGNGSYADVLGIFAAANEDSAQGIYDMVSSYVDDLKASFEDYIPEEVSKIENRVLEKKGKYVTLCITNDYSNAKKVIDGYFKESSKDSTGSLSGEDVGSEDNQPEDVPDKTPTHIEEQEKSYVTIELNGEVENYGNVIAVGDTAYELYSYSEKAAGNYSAAVNKIADKLKGQANVYDILAPLSSEITLPDELLGQISSGSQIEALAKIKALLDENVIVINPYENLMKHRDQYIYFRTDHHWTALGAYYAYEEFCKAKGIEPIPLENHESVDFDGFLGSFYKDTKNSKKLNDNPDDIKAYYPVSTDTSLTFTDSNGKSYDWKVIWDVSDYRASAKYSTFIAGDNPYTVIKNHSLGEGPSCVVVKESFGNALVPFLVDHYKKIYVIDYRYWQGNLESLAKEKKADDLIFINNLSMIRSDYLVGKLNQIIG